MTEAQLRHAVERFVGWLMVTVVVAIAGWAVWLALGVVVHPLVAFACAGVAVWVADSIWSRRSS